MIAVDTNVIVRFLTRDDEKQFQKAATFFTENDIFIPLTVVLKTEWVLRYSYNFQPAAIFAAFAKTFGLPNVTLQSANAVAHAIDLARKGLDFADALHLSTAQECESFATFDADFIKRAEKLGSYKLEKP